MIIKCWYFLEVIKISDFSTINVVLNSSSPVNEPIEFENIINIDNTPLQKVKAEFDKLIGLEHIKTLIEEIYALVKINELRKEHGLKCEKQSLHMLFKGNPGTGKTTVARLLGEFFANINILENGKLHEIERADLVGEYIGHTAMKTREVIRKAKGGVLFVDEAYSLARGGSKDFGREAIDTLVKHMEDSQHEFVLILAGYSKEMDYFLKLNPGLESRFQIVVDFENFNIEELMRISGTFLKEKEYLVSSEAFELMKTRVRNSMDRPDFSNGRFVRNMIEKAIRAHALRIIRSGLRDRSSLMNLKPIDFREI